MTLNVKDFQLKCQKEQSATCNWFCYHCIHWFISHNTNNGGYKEQCVQFAIQLKVNKARRTSCWKHNSNGILVI